MVTFSTVTISAPNGPASTFTGWTLVGTADQGLAVNDASDATYLDDSATPGIRSYAVYDVANPVIPSGAKIYAVRSSVRASETTNQPFGSSANWLQIGQSTTDGQYWDGVNAHPAAATTYSFGWRTTSPGGAEWTQALLDALQLVLSVYQQSAVLDWRVYRAYFDVAYNQRPTVTVTGPAEGGTVTDTTTPTVTWTYSDPESDPQERFQVKVFTSAQYGAAGFDPETSAATYDSGEVYSSVPSHTITTALATTGTYRAYVKAAQSWSTAHWSAWDNNTFTMAVDGPAVPTVSLTAYNGVVGDGVGPYVAVDVFGTDNMLTANQASLETDTTGWGAGGNTTIVRTTSQALHGAASLRMDSVAAGDISAFTTRVSVVAGKQYSALASFRSAVIPRSARVQIDWYDAVSGGSLISSSTGSNVTTTTTGWTQATLAATAPVGALGAAIIVRVVATSGAAEVHYVDAIKISPGSSTTWTRGGLGTTVQILVEYSDDAGATWTAAWGGWRANQSAMSLQTWPAFDFTIPTGTTRQYRATARALVGSNYLLSSPSATASTSVTLSAWWLSDPLQALGVAVRVVAGSLTWAGDHLEFEAVFRNKQDWDTFATLWNLNRTILLRTDMPGILWYVRLIGDRVGVFRALGRTNPVAVADTVNPLPEAELLATRQRVATPVRRARISAVTQDPIDMLLFSAV